MLDAAVDRTEGGEEPDPGIVPPLQDLLALLVGRLLEPGHEGRDGVVLVVERVAQQQQVPLLGREQEHQPHHDREGGPVEFGLGHARQELPLFVLVDPVERPDDLLDGLAHLIAQPVGDFLLVRGAVLEHLLQRVGVRRREEPAHAQQAAKRPERERLLQPEGRIPRGKAGRLTPRRIDQHPVLAVGDESQPHVGGVQQLHHPGRRRCLPMPAGDRLFEVLFRRIHLDQQPGLPGAGNALGVADDHIGPERLAVLRDPGLERLGNVLTFRQHLTGQPERLLEHEANPLPMDRRSWRIAVPILLPLVKRQPQHPDMIRVVGVEPLRKHPLQHRHRQERAGDLDQGEPFGVVAGGGHLEFIISRRLRSTQRPRP